MARVGRPRKRIDLQEWFSFFAKLPSDTRAYALEVTQALHGALSPETLQDGSGEPRTPANPTKEGEDQSD